MVLTARQNARLRQRFEAYCQLRGLSERRLAEVSGVSIGAVRSVGKTPAGPTLATLLALAKALELPSLDQLLGPSGTVFLQNHDHLERDAGQAAVTLFAALGLDKGQSSP